MQAVKQNEFIDFWSNSDQPWALFVGAGISHGEPSRLPLSREVKSYLVRVLSDTDTLPYETKRHSSTQILEAAGQRLLSSNNFFESLEGIPLEAILGSLQKFLVNKSINIARNLITPLFGETRAFNACHEAIAVLIKTGRVRFIFTTNYDCLLESALDNLGLEYEVVSDRKAFAAWNDDERLLDVSHAVIFKLHGDGKPRSRSENEPDEIVVTAQDIGRGLPEDKRRVLLECLRRYNFLFLGYAGRDWDIEPILYESFLEITDPARCHYWVTRCEEDLPPLRFRVKCFPSNLEDSTNILLEMLGKNRSHLDKEPMAVGNSRLNMQGIDRFVALLDLHSRLLALAGIYHHTGLGQYSGELINTAEQLAAVSPIIRLYYCISLIQDNLWGKAKPKLQVMSEDSSLPLGIQAALYHNLSFCFQQEGRVDLAEKNYQLSLSLFQQANKNPRKSQYDPSAEAQATVSYASFLILQGEKQRKNRIGRDQIEKAINILEKVESSGLNVEPRFFADVGLEKGAAYQVIGNYLEAMTVLKRAIDIAEQWKYRQQATTSYFKLCTAYYLQVNHWRDPFATMRNSDWQLARSKFHEYIRSVGDRWLSVEELALWAPPIFNILGPPLYWFMKTRLSKWAKRYLPSLSHDISNFFSKIPSFFTAAN